MTVLESTLSVENRYRQLFRQRLVILAVIFIAIIASLLLDFTLGPSGLPLHSLIKTLMHPSGATNGMRVIVWDIRLPYALMALLSALLLDSLTRWTRVPTSGVVLFGIALVFTFNALVSIMQFVADEDTLQGLVFWTMGSLARASWEKLAVLAAAMAIVLPWSLRRAWQLTALRLGEERAMSFGIDVRRLRLGSLLRISLLAALSVAFVGPIGFIGLVAPHISRLLLGEDHRFYLPGSILIGGLVLSLASVASKNIIPGVILPVGIVTSLVGVPFFLSIVMRHRGSMS
ncbi:iron ABC transporter permease [Escherichia coli]